MLQARGIQKSYGNLQILKGVDLDVKRGEIITIIGASGAGKSTLLHIIGTLDRPDHGTIRLNNVDVHKLSSKKLSAFRNEQIGFIFQFHHLLPELPRLKIYVFQPLLLVKVKRKLKVRLLNYWNCLGSLSGRITSPMNYQVVNSNVWQ